jgi:DNA-binding GntR family transcriptional regulator
VTTNSSQAATHRTLVDEVANVLQRRIESGELQVGSWLRQQALAVEFGVSKTPVREALQKLQALGYVDVVRNRGVRVRLASRREITEAYQVRAVLEGLSAELATDYISQAQLDDLRAAEQLFQGSVGKLIAHRRDQTYTEGVDDAQWVGADENFHDIVHAAACNERLRAVIRNLHVRVPRTLAWVALHADLRLLEESAAQHRAILDAIEQRDRNAAQALMIQHVRRAGELAALRYPADNALPLE